MHLINVFGFAFHCCALDISHALACCRSVWTKMNVGSNLHERISVKTCVLAPRSEWLWKQSAAEVEITRASGRVIEDSPTDTAAFICTKKLMGCPISQYVVQHSTLQHLLCQTPRMLNSSFSVKSCRSRNRILSAKGFSSFAVPCRDMRLNLWNETFMADWFSAKQTDQH